MFYFMFIMYIWFGVLKARSCFDLTRQASKHHRVVPSDPTLSGIQERIGGKTKVMRTLR